MMINISVIYIMIGKESKILAIELFVNGAIAHNQAPCM
jgi:hypothetical protein